jgi:hypothetical protein
MRRADRARRRPLRSHASLVATTLVAAPLAAWVWRSTRERGPVLAKAARDMGSYGFTVHAAMAGWYPLCFVLFVLLPPARAVAVGLVTGFLLLPNVVYVLPGVPNYDKGLAIVLGVCASAALVDLPRLLSFRPRWVDLPVVVLCAAPFFSSLAAGSGAYDGCSKAFDFTVRWALPWFLGRVYFTDFDSQRFLGIAIVVGALVYVPFALWEVKMSPQLHVQVYGVALRSFKHARRAFGLWRPNVFVVHGLAYALFNALAALVALWLWHTKSVRRVLSLPMGPVAAVLVAMAFAAQSSNAILLMLVGTAVLIAGGRYRRALPVLVLLLVPPLYVTARQALRWDGRELVAVAESVFGPTRAQSLDVRIESEALLRDRILERPWLGYNDFQEFTATAGARSRTRPCSWTAAGSCTSGCTACSRSPACGPCSSCPRGSCGAAAARVVEPSRARARRRARGGLAADHARRSPERVRDPGLHRGRGRSRAAPRNEGGTAPVASVTPALATRDTEPFFLVGSERSGTTLLRLMLSHHARIDCAPEFEFLVEELPPEGWPELERYRANLSVNRVFLAHRLAVDSTLDYPR